MPKFREVRSIREEHWQVHRTGRVDEVVNWDHSVRWRVELQDDDREVPFVKQFFNDPDAANDFLDKVMGKKG